MPDRFTSLVTSNSTTYADLLGVLVGLERLVGEDASSFVDRVQQAAKADRSAAYEGLVNELLLSFGLETDYAATVQSTGTDTIPFNLDIDISGLRLTRDLEEFSIPFVTVGGDDFWQWRQIKDVVADLNRIPGIQAKLLHDGPALQLAKQSNIGFTVGEPISGKMVALKNTVLIPESLQFNLKVPEYTVNGNVLSFASNVPDSTEVTYKFRKVPYKIIQTPAVAMSLLSPEFQRLAEVPDGTRLVYQARDFISEIANKDRSYWGR